MVTEAEKGQPGTGEKKTAEEGCPGSRGKRGFSGGKAACQAATGGTRPEPGTPLGQEGAAMREVAAAVGSVLMSEGSKPLPPPSLCKPHCPVSRAEVPKRSLAFRFQRHYPLAG